MKVNCQRCNKDIYNDEVTAFDQCTCAQGGHSKEFYGAFDKKEKDITDTFNEALKALLDDYVIEGEITFDWVIGKKDIKVTIQTKNYKDDERSD
jgi:hypothetical protein